MLLFQGVQFHGGAAEFHAALFSGAKAFFEKGRRAFFVAGEEMFHARIIIGLTKLNGLPFRVPGGSFGNIQKIFFGHCVGKELSNPGGPVSRLCALKGFHVFGQFPGGVCLFTEPGAEQPDAEAGIIQQRIKLE